AVVGGMVGGVGQRVLSGVARKTAAEFFAAIDDVLAGAAAPTAAAPTAATPTAVYTGPAAARGGSRPGELWAMAAAAGVGAFAALSGVAVGWALARSAARRR